MKCDWFTSFIQVERNRTHPIFQKLFVTKILQQVFMSLLFYTAKLVESYGFRKNVPGKKAPEKIDPWKITPWKYAPKENCPPKSCFTRFVLLLTIFIATSFRGVSRTPKTSVIDLFVKVANGINYCQKELLFRCCRGSRFASEFIR